MARFFLFVMRYTIIIMRDIIIVKKQKKLRPAKKKKPEQQTQTAPAVATGKAILIGAAVQTEPSPTPYTTPRQPREEMGGATETEAAAPPLPGTLSWEALEYAYHPKSADWYWMVGFLSVLVVVAAVLLHNFLLGVLAIVGGFTVMLLGAKRPQKFLFRLSAGGVTIHQKLYPYGTLDSFWVHYEPGGKKALSIVSKKKMMPLFMLPLDTMDPVVVRDYLLQFLKEAPQEESVIDELSERLGW